VFIEAGFLRLAALRNELVNMTTGVFLDCNISCSESLELMLGLEDIVVVVVGR
jgi:hypothetical protein